MPVVLGPITANDTEIVSWIDASGTSHPLSTGAPTILLPGRRGWWTLPSRLVTQDLALQPGAAFRSAKDAARPLDLALYISSTTEPAAVRAIVRDLHRWFDPNAGAGYLHVNYGDSERQIPCRPLGVVPAEQDTPWLTPRTLVVSLEALHPYWQAVTPSEATFSPGAGAGSFFPILPLSLTASSLFAQLGVTNSGDVESWPIWTIDGPAQDIVLTNVTTGKAFALRTDFVMAAGDRLTVDTRPQVRSVRDRDDNSRFGYQTPTSELWPLVYGVNDVRVQMGSTDATTLVTLAYTPEYRAP